MTATRKLLTQMKIAGGGGESKRPPSLSSQS